MEEFDANSTSILQKEAANASNILVIFMNLKNLLMTSNLWTKIAHIVIQTM
jgi:hypothetical protein